MARPSAASQLNVIPTGIPKPLDPPASLTPQQRDVWLTCTQSKPADWFPPDSAPLLLEYVRSVTLADELENMIRAALGDGTSMRDLRNLLNARDKESRRVLLIATKLRLTQQSRYTPMAAATAAKKTPSRPWQEVA